MKPEIPVKQGETYRLEITGLTDNAEGVAKADGFTVFVPGTLPGEIVSGKVNLVKKNYARAKLVSLEKESPDRIKPRCEHYESCGGCQLQHLSYEAQCKMKKAQVEEALCHIGGITGVKAEDTLGAVEPWYYRNKMQFPVGKNKGIIRIGCYEQGTHRIIDTPNCYIQNEGNNIIAAAMREAIKRFNISVYDENNHSGCLRHVMGRVGKHDEAMVVLVTATKRLENDKALVRFLRERIPNLVSVYHNIQTYRNNVILGRETRLLWGKSTISDNIGSYVYHISPRSFFQVNTAQATVLYEKVREYAGLTGKETVIDAYCGTGTISLFLAKNAKKVYGIEIVSPAIADAKKNARDNNIRNAEFIVGDATIHMPKLYCEGIEPQVIVIDPPRAGATPEVLDTMAKLKPDRIVYVSCNPATLARDLAILLPKGFKLEKVQPVDMFPQTMHVESVVLMSRDDR